MNINTVLLELGIYDEMQKKISEGELKLKEYKKSLEIQKETKEELLKYISDSYIQTLESYMFDGWEEKDFGEYSGYNKRLSETIEIGNKFDHEFGDKLIERMNNIKYGTIERTEKQND